MQRSHSVRRPIEFVNDKPWTASGCAFNVIDRAVLPAQCELLFASQRLCPGHRS
jgi:hypothetical protein